MYLNRLYMALCVRSCDHLLNGAGSYGACIESGQPSNSSLLIGEEWPEGYKNGGYHM